MQTHHVQIDGGWRAVQLLHTDATVSPNLCLVRDVFNGDVFWVPYDKLENVVKRSEWENTEDKE